MNLEGVNRVSRLSKETKRRKHISVEDFFQVCDLELSEMFILENIQSVYSSKKGFSDATKIRIKFAAGLGKLEKIAELFPRFLF